MGLFALPDSGIQLEMNFVNLPTCYSLLGVFEFNYFKNKVYFSTKIVILCSDVKKLLYYRATAVERILCAVSPEMVTGRSLRAGFFPLTAFPEG